MSELKIFNSAVRCPKCGDGLIRSAFVEADGCNPAGFFEKRYDDETIWRRCSRCNYHWSELPIDEESQEQKFELLSLQGGHVLTYSGLEAENTRLKSEVERLREFVRGLRDFRTKDHIEGRDRGEYGFALYGSDGAMLDVTGTDALDAWQKLDGQSHSAGTDRGA